MKTTGLIPVDQIVVKADRQRQEMHVEEIVNLADSIKQHGLLHAIAVSAEDSRTLIAGERRLRAIRDFIYGLGRTFSYDGEVVPVGLIPVVLMWAADDIALEEIELDENIKRKDLTWPERAAAESRLHNIRAARAKVSGIPYTMVDTAMEVAEAKGHTSGPTAATHNLRQSIIVAKAMQENPALAGAKSIKDAFKMIQRAEETKRNERLAVAVGADYSSASHQAVHADSLEWMHAAGPGIFDVICTDPPYGMGAHTFGDGAGRLLSIEHHYDDSYENWVKLMSEWVHLAYDICKRQAHAYIFCDFDRFHELKDMMVGAGWYVFRTPLINVKSGSGRVPLPDKGPRRQYEIALYAIKGDKMTTGIYSDVITSEADEQLGHGAQKPVSLYVDLLKRSCRPGDRVLDSFSGSGTIFPAAHELKLYAVGVEKNLASYGKGLERLAALERTTV